MKFKSVINKGLLIGLGIIPLALFAQDTTIQTRHEFSVQDAVNYASKNNIQVKNALVDILIQEQTNRERLHASSSARHSSDRSTIGLLRLFEAKTDGRTAAALGAVGCAARRTEH